LPLDLNRKLTFDKPHKAFGKVCLVYDEPWRVVKIVEGIAGL
jgi:hypothetical protein